MRRDIDLENDERLRRGPYLRRSLNEKRKIVELCLKPGASVAGTALAHGVNANLVRKWIAKYRAGEYGQTKSPLLPVVLSNHVAAAPPSAEMAKGFLEIELPGARVRVHGRVDDEILRTVLGLLSR